MHGWVGVVIPWYGALLYFAFAADSSQVLINIVMAMSGEIIMITSWKLREELQTAFK